MSIPLTLSGNFSDLGEKQKLPLIVSIVFLIGIFGLILLGTQNDMAYISFGIIGSVMLFYLMARYPRFWIYLIALTNIYFFYDRDSDVSVFEIILAVQYFGTGFFWLFWTLFVKRERIIDNIADIFILFFIVIILVNSIIGYLNSNDMFYWIRESFNLFLIILYFPVKKYFTDKKHLVTLLIIYCIVVSASSFLHIITYLKFLQGDIKYAFQLMRSIRVNQTLFTAASVFGFLFALYNRKKINSVLLIMFTSVSIVGLVTSFSRTFWVILLAELIIAIFYLTGKQRVKLISYTLFISMILFFTLFYVFEDRTKIMLKVIENRFVSTGKGVKDVSVQARFAEYEEVWKGIKEYPMAGNGMSKEISFWNTLTAQTSRERYTHNGYLQIMYKLGIPAMVVCFFPYFFFLSKGERLARREKDEFFRLLCLGSFLAILLMLFSNLTAHQISMREGNFVTLLSFAFISIVMNRAKISDLKNDSGE